jgi:hypothetical protein
MPNDQEIEAFTNMVRVAEAYAERCGGMSVAEALRVVMRVLDVMQQVFPSGAGADPLSAVRRAVRISADGRAGDD